MWKCWDDAPHIGSFQKYPTEYVRLIHELLDFEKLLPERVKSPVEILAHL